MENFPRSVRLRRHALISNLFKEGNSFYMHPFKVYWMCLEAGLPSPYQVLFAVSRRNMKNAVSRNRVRRLMREAFRQNKHFLPVFPEGTKYSLIFAILYTGSELPQFWDVRDKIISLLRRLSGDYEKSIG